MAQTETIRTPQDFVNYTFNVQARGITELSTELAGLSNTASNVLGLLAFKTSEFLTNTESLAMGAGVAISALFVSATESAMQFEQQIANVQAIGGEAVNANAIGSAAMEYSNKFGMATSAMTEGLESLARAGITTTSVMKGVLEEGVKLSKLEGMDLEDSINDLISTTNLLSADDVNMNSPEYARMVKDMNQHIVSTSESAPIDASNIIQSLQHVGGYASASGIDQDDLFAVIAQLGSRGTKGEMAGTALRAFVSAGQKDTAQRALSRIGLSVEDLWDKSGEIMLPISEMKDVLDNALEKRGYSQQEKLEFYSDFAGYKQANQIMKIDTSEVQQYKESIAGAWDLGKKLDTILGTVRGNLDRISQITHNFMTRVGNQSLKTLNVILTPLRVMLELITKIPFIDKITAFGMLFVAFRTGLMIFNKLTPAIFGFLSGIDKANGKTLDLKNAWRGTVDSIKEAKDIIFAIKDQDQSKLTEIHYREHGLSAKNRANAEELIAGQMYLGSDFYKKTKIPWEKLDVSAKDMILERLKGTDQFKQNYERYVELTRKSVNEIVSEPIIIEDFSKKDTLEAISGWVEEIFHLMNGLSVTDPLTKYWAEELPRLVDEKKKGKTQNEEVNVEQSIVIPSTDSDNNGPKNNRDKNTQEGMIARIMRNYSITPEIYGNYEFAYRNDNGFEKLKARTEQSYRDLERKIKSFSNTNFAEIDKEQKNVYRKLLYREAMSPLGKKYAAMSNESEVRLALEKGRFQNENRQWYQGVRDNQIYIMGKALDVDMSDFHKTTPSNDQRSEYISKIHEALNKINDKEKRKDIIDIIVAGTNDIWENEITKKNTLTVDPRKVLRNNEQLAKKVAYALNLHRDHPELFQGGYGEYAKAVHMYFEDESNRNNTAMVDKATEVLFENLKKNEQFSMPEEREIRYVIENLQKLRNTFQYFTDDNIHESFEEEIKTIAKGMDEYNELFKKGGEELGEAIVKGFVVDGLGIHSPGFMYWAYMNEQENIKKAILQSKDELGKASSELGSEISKSFNDKLNLEHVNQFSGRIIDVENKNAKKANSTTFDKTFEHKNKLNNINNNAKLNNNSTFSLLNNEKKQNLYDDNIYNYILFDTLKNIKEETNKRTISPEKLFDIINTEHGNINGIEKFFNNNYKSNSGIFYRNGKIKITKLMNALSIEKELDKKYLSSDSKITSQEWGVTRDFTNANDFNQNRQTTNLNNINNTILLSALKNIKRKHKRVISQEELFNLIRSEHSEHKANGVEKFFNDNYKSDSLVIKENGKIRINNLIKDLEIENNDIYATIFDALNYIQRVENRRSITVDELAYIIGLEYGYDNRIKTLFSKTRMRTGKQSIDKLINPMLNEFPKSDFRRSTEPYYSIVSPRKVFDIINKHPESKDILLDHLSHGLYYNVPPKLENFKGVEDKEYISIPYEYTWFLGPNAGALYDITKQKYTPSVIAKKYTPLSLNVARSIVGDKNFNHLFHDIIPTNQPHYEQTIPKSDYQFLSDQLIKGIAFTPLSAGRGSGSNFVKNNGIKIGKNRTQTSGATQTLNALIQEFTRMILNHDKREELSEIDSLSILNSVSNGNPYFSKLSELNSMSIPKDLTDIMGKNSLSEFESNWIAYKIFKKYGLENEIKVGSMKPSYRLKAYHKTVDNAGYRNHFQWGLYDEWSNVLDTHIDTLIDIGEAFDQQHSDLTSEEIAQQWNKIRNIIKTKRKMPPYVTDTISGNWEDIEYYLQNLDNNNQYKFFTSVRGNTVGIGKKKSRNLSVRRYENRYNENITRQIPLKKKAAESSKKFYEYMQLLKDVETKYSYLARGGVVSNDPTKLDQFFYEGPGDIGKILQQNALLGTTLLKDIEAGKYHTVSIWGLKNKKGEDLSYTKMGRYNNIAKLGVGALKIRKDAESGKYSYIKNQNITPSKQTTLGEFSEELKAIEDAQNIESQKKTTIERQGNLNKYFNLEENADGRQTKLDSFFNPKKTQEIPVLKQTTFDTNFDKTTKKMIEQRERLLDGRKAIRKDIKAGKYSDIIKDFELRKYSVIQGAFIGNLIPEKKNITSKQETLDTFWDRERALEEQAKDLEEQAKDLEEQAKKYSHVRGVTVVDPRNRFDKARDIMMKYGGGKNSISFIDSLENTHNKLKSGRDSAINSFVNMSKNIKIEGGIEKTNKEYIKNITDIKGGLEGATKRMKNFHDGLSEVAKKFSFLSPVVFATEIAIKALEMATIPLKIAEDLLTGSRIFNKLATWGVIKAEQAKALQEATATVATKAFNVAIRSLTYIISNPAILVAIAAIIAAIAALKFWENKHAESLKRTQKELEESIAKNNIAVSQYKDLKKARENETDAIRRQKAARREAIALYELEASRIKARKTVQDEAKLRNDWLWGEYGLRAAMQKIGLGFIAGGDFKSQYEQYDGTTANIRQIKEGTLGNLFATQEQKYVGSLYDNNSQFFAEVEAYKDPLQELYDKESKLIEQYGSIDIARGTKEFEEAVQEFADATGINGKTAVKMLNWLETENKVNQASQVGEAEIGIIMARRQAKLMEIEYGDQFDNTDFNDVGNVMLMAQFQEMMNNSKTEIWWDLLFSYLELIVTAINPLNWLSGDVSKKLAIIGANQDTLTLLNEKENSIYNDMLEAYNNSERRDYGSGLSYSTDTPFGGAIEAAGVMHAEKAQQRYFAATGSAMSEEDYITVQNQYTENVFNTTSKKIQEEKVEKDIEAHEEAQNNANITYVENTDNQNYHEVKIEENTKATLDQLQDNGEQAHEDALSIVDAIKNPGVVSGIGASINSLRSSDSPIFKSVRRKGSEDIFKWMSGEEDTITGKTIKHAKPKIKTARAAYADDGFSGVYEYGKELASEGIGKAKSGLSTLKSKATTAKNTYKSIGIKGIIKRGENAYGEIGGARGIISATSTEVGGVKGLASTTASGMKDLLNPKAIAGEAGSVAKGLKGGGTLMKGVGRLGSRALAFLGPALAFTEKASELNPMEKHYNEDGTEKKALQATGEVVGTTAGALGGVAGGMAGAEAGAALGATIGSIVPGIGTVIGGAVGAVAGGIAGGWLGDTIFQPIGDAIGGTIGWLGDNLLGGIQNVAGTVWNGLSSAAGAVWGAVSGAATGAWDFVTSGATSGIGIITGITDWLFGGGEDPYANTEEVMGKKMSQGESKSENTIVIENININTEDDPEKIKSALMNLIIEMQEQISPRQVSRTVGEPPSKTVPTNQNNNNMPQTNGVDSQNNAQNNNNQNNNNPTV